MHSACKCSNASNVDLYKLRLSLLYKGAECIYRISEHKALCLHTCLDTVTLLCGNETPRVVCLHSTARLHVESVDRYFGGNSFNNAGLDPRI